MKRLALIAGGLLMLTLGLGTGLAWQSFTQFREQALALPEATRLEVHTGDSVGQVLRRLEAQGLTQYDWRWRLLLRLAPVTIRTGEYLLPAASRPGELLELLASGRVIQYRFTVVEGWTWRQLREALLARSELAVDPAGLQTGTVMQQLGSSETDPEGWFLPETYAFTRGEPALDLLARAHQAMRAALEEVWRTRAIGLPLTTPYELLTLASIIEKESAHAAERGQIAGVFMRRLQLGWRLETDPAVIYGLGETYDGDLRRRDLETDTPYNTYTRHGLPPTPIAMPGLSALEAAARPLDGQAMFFVSDGRGGHVFSDTLEAHNRAVRQLTQGNKGG